MIQNYNNLSNNKLKTFYYTYVEKTLKNIHFDKYHNLSK